VEILDSPLSLYNEVYEMGENKRYTDKQLLEIGIKKRQGKLQKSWQTLAETYARGRFRDGEQFRSWVKNKVLKDGRKSERITIKPSSANYDHEKVKNKEEINIKADGTHEIEKIVDFKKSEFEIEEGKLKDKNYLLEFHGYNPKEFKLLTARSSMWEVPTGDENEPVRIQYASKITVKPYDTELTEEKSVELYMAELEIKKQIQINQQYKNEINKLIRNEASKDLVLDLIKKSVADLEKIKPLSISKSDYYPYVESSPCKVYGNVIWSDWHYAAEVNNTFNTYNTNIFELRLRKLIDETINSIYRFGVTHLTIGNIGDMISGAIHVSTRVQASEDVITQITYVSERIAEAVAEISGHVEYIKFINVMGNHSRLVADKQQALLNENLERIIPWYLQARIGHIENIELVHGEDGYYIDNTFNDPHLYVHGDLDKVDKVVKTASQLMNIIPTLIFSGHIHHHTLKEHGKTIVISNGSMVGLDDYAVGGRFAGQPMQLFHVFTESGKIDVQKPIYFDGIGV